MNKHIIAALAVATLAGCSGGDTIREYALSCSDGECFPVNITEYRVSAATQTVVSTTVGVEDRTSPIKHQPCTVANARNWVCKDSIGGRVVEPVQEYGFRDGMPFSTGGLAGLDARLGHRFVSRWEYLRVAFKRDPAGTVVRFVTGAT
jgi:hypothetical protein